MKIAYLILAHDNPKQFHRLVNALSSPSSACFVHIDKKADIRDFSNNTNSSVYFLKERVKVYRGHFSHVEAELLLIQEALKHPNCYDRFVLLSGTDYPIRSLDYIEHFFDSNETSEFMNITKMPNNSVGKPLSRLYGYNPTPTKPRFFIEILLHAIFSRLRIIPKQRNYQKYLGNLLPFAGSEWWALTRNACEYILNFAQNNRRLLKFLVHSYTPQEMFFQTVLGNSPFMENITRNVTYTDWQAGGGHPAWIDEKHLEKYKTRMLYANDAFGKGELLFARKFSDNANNIIGLLHGLIAANE